ncbi:hypothetical protein [Nocardia paucivorans]|uniref:hypothetical protein n=1 Tax=Nocardia paucivorans TaxID=114259 RepID=UPI0002E737D0|nr:hypothetical protein [Nocardia paucivorans]
MRYERRTPILRTTANISSVFVQMNLRDPTDESAEHLWEGRPRRLTSVWVRWYNDGGDFDEIDHRPIAQHMRREDKYCYRGGTWIRQCRYAYDGIRIIWQHSSLTVTSFGGWHWRRGGSVYVVDAPGDYPAGNNRCDLPRRERHSRPPHTDTDRGEVRLREVLLVAGGGCSIR